LQNSTQLLHGLVFEGSGDGSTEVTVAFAVPLPVMVVGRLPPANTILEGELVVEAVWFVPLFTGTGVPLNPRIVVVPIVLVLVVLSSVIYERISRVEIAVGIERVIVDEYETYGPFVSTRLSVFVTGLVSVPERTVVSCCEEVLTAIASTGRYFERCILQLKLHTSSTS